MKGGLAISTTESNAVHYIPLNQKFLLTIPEAVIYFGIGEPKLRQIAKENQSADFILMNGTKTLYKRAKFENYLNDIYSI